MGELRDGARVQDFIDGWSPAVADVNDLNDQCIACVKPYTSLYAGIADTNPGNIFEVQHATTPTPAPLVPIYSYDLGGATAIDCVCSDGKYFYVAKPDGAGHTNLFAYRKDTGVQIWTVDLGVVAITAAAVDATIFSDGAYLYYPDLDGMELVALNVADGTEASRVAMNGAAEPHFIHSNGLYVIVSGYDTDECQTFKWVGAALVYQHKFSHGDTVYLPFCGDTFGVYCAVPDPATAKIVVVFNLATGAEIISYQASDWAGLVIPTFAYQAYSDGDHLWFTTDCAQLTAAGQYNCAWKASLSDGTAAGIFDLGIDRGAAGPDAHRISGDGERLFVFLSTGALDIIDADSMVPCFNMTWGVGPPTILFGECHDGECIIGYYNAGAGHYYILGESVGLSTRKYVRMSPSTSNVRRFPVQGMLAIPLT